MLNYYAKMTTGLGVAVFILQVSCFVHMVKMTARKKKKKKKYFQLANYVYKSSIKS